MCFAGILCVFRTSLKQGHPAQGAAEHLAFTPPPVAVSLPTSAPSPGCQEAGAALGLWVWGQQVCGDIPAGEHRAKTPGPPRCSQLCPCCILSQADFLHGETSSQEDRGSCCCCWLSSALVPAGIEGLWSDSKNQAVFIEKVLEDSWKRASPLRWSGEKPLGSLPLHLRGAPAFGILRKGEAGYISTGRIYFYFLNNCKMSHLAPPQSAAHQQGASRGAASASAANKPRTTAAASPPEEPAGEDAVATLPGTIPIPTCGGQSRALVLLQNKKNP